MAEKESELALPRADVPARAALLLGLPAQHLDRGAGRLARARRHRLPLHGHVDGPQHRHLHAHGRRRRDLVRARRRSPRRSTCSRTSATAPTSIPARWRSASRSPPKRQHHLQDPLQRRGRDDRRPAGRRHADACRRSRTRCAAKACRRSSCCRDDIEKWSDPAIFPVGVEFFDRNELDDGAEAPARSAGHVGADLRPDLRDREAPPPQARQDGRSGRSA